MRIGGGLGAALAFLVATNASAVTVDDLIAKYVAARGGIQKLRAIHSLRASGKMQFGGGGFSMSYSWMAKRPEMVRTEATIQGLTAVRAYDGAVGWQLQPFGGRRDPEKMAADEVKELKVSADLDGPLVDYKAKGNTVEYLGTEDVDGTDAHKIKVTLASGNVRYIYLDPDYFLEIRRLDQTRIRGAEVEFETDLGDYELVNGVYLPFSIEVGAKGGPKGQKITIEKIDVNVDLDDTLFHFPTAPAAVSK